MKDDSGGNKILWLARNCCWRLNLPSIYFVRHIDDVSQLERPTSFQCSQPFIRIEWCYPLFLLFMHWSVKLAIKMVFTQPLKCSLHIGNGSIFCGCMAICFPSILLDVFFVTYHHSVRIIDAFSLYCFLYKRLMNGLLNGLCNGWSSIECLELDSNRLACCFLYKKQ